MTCGYVFTMLQRSNNGLVIEEKIFFGSAFEHFISLGKETFFKAFYTVYSTSRQAVQGYANLPGTYSCLKMSSTK